MYKPVVVPVLLIVTVNAASEFADTVPGVTLALHASAAQIGTGCDNHSADKQKVVIKAVMFDRAAYVFICIYHT